MLKGEVGYNNRLRDFQPICWQISSFENVVTSTFQAISKLLTQKETPAKSSEHLANCNFANLLVCHTNGYHLTAMLQLKIKASVSENNFQICSKLGLPTSNQRLDDRSKFSIRYDISGHLV